MKNINTTSLKLRSTGRLILALFFLAFSTPQFSYLMDQSDTDVDDGNSTQSLSSDEEGSSTESVSSDEGYSYKRKAVKELKQRISTKRSRSDAVSSDDFVEYYFDNYISELLFRTRFGNILAIKGLDECTSDSCSLRRIFRARDFFETHVLNFLGNGEFFAKLFASRTLHITDFASGELFQTFVLVRKLIERALALLELREDEKLIVLVDIIDPIYSTYDDYGLRIKIRDIIQRFQDYFVYFYSKRSKINFVLNVFSDGSDYDKHVGGAHLVVCADFERASYAIDEYNQIKLPAEFIEKLSSFLKLGECFCFSSLSKNGFKTVEGKISDFCVCIFSFKCAGMLKNDTQGFMQVIPFKKGESLKGRMFNCIPCPEERLLVPWTLNRDRI